MKRNYWRVEAGGRYGYGAVDIYYGDACQSTMIAGITQKDARHLAIEINSLLEKVRKHKKGFIA